ncbi:hypothetical protein AB1Y20_005769 [Prymnesium parvum]|uniref:Uncharacterized protein n=1 Tax=Prymnesium parvum TaxID=97485 RepID=A0AB34J1Y2_PRYPA|mmetsp:Transcript_17669/g.42343  ORF Transcript_17669/g.42343 Transcript_17669/m.42343 type:complete len:232 (-) Transcript_17669:163-858(-)
MKLPDGVDGFFYTSPDEYDAATAAALRELGWSVVVSAMLPSTKHTSAARLTAKRHKWLCPWEVQRYDFVATHDANVRLDYSKLRCFLEQHMAVPKVDLVLKDWFKAWMPAAGLYRSVYSEIDDMLFNRPEFVASSREKVVEWRDFLLRSKYEDKGYFETDVILFRPASSALSRVGRRIFERCHEVPRDQFILPWAITKEEMTSSEFAVFSEDDLERLLGYTKLLQLRLKRN